LNNARNIRGWLNAYIEYTHELTTRTVNRYADYPPLHHDDLCDGTHKQFLVDRLGAEAALRAHWAAATERRQVVNYVWTSAPDAAVAHAYRAEFADAMEQSQRQCESVRVDIKIVAQL
jgi:hypothetical protein